MFAVIGHVDHGKSTLCGRLLVDTGAVPAEEFAAIRRRAAAEGAGYAVYARVLDVCEEEQRKSKTHEWSAFDFAYAGAPHTLIDTPGHKGFIRSMIAGLSGDGVRAAVLVVSAKAGEFEGGFERGGQTKEDILLARAFGVDRLVVAVNKMDTVGWDARRFGAIRAKVAAFAAPLAFASVDCVPVSGLTGDNLLRRTAAGEPCLMEAVAAAAAAGAAAAAAAAAAAEDADGGGAAAAVLVTACRGSFKLLASDMLLCSGWRGVAHVGGEEVDAELTMEGHVTAPGARFEATLVFSHPVAVHRGSRVVVRSGTATVAQGRAALLRPANRAAQAALQAAQR